MVRRRRKAWFFEDREALIDQWKSKNTGDLVARTEAYAESIAEAILNVFDGWLDARLFDSQFEFAMRSWALQSAEVAQDIADADALRIAALKAMFDRGLIPPRMDVAALSPCPGPRRAASPPTRADASGRSPDEAGGAWGAC